MTWLAQSEHRLRLWVWFQYSKWLIDVSLPLFYSLSFSFSPCSPPFFSLSDQWTHILEWGLLKKKKGKVKMELQNLHIFRGGFLKGFDPAMHDPPAPSSVWTLPRVTVVRWGTHQAPGTCHWPLPVLKALSPPFLRMRMLNSRAQNQTWRTLEPLAERHYSSGDSFLKQERGWN